MASQDRRAWILETLGSLGLLSAGANAVLAQHGHAVGKSSAEDALTASDWKPAVLSVAQSHSLASLGDAIIPGSSAAHCDRIIDLLLTLETASVRAKLGESIAAFEKEAQARWHKAFQSLSPAEQTSLLQAASAKASPLANSFENVKSWVADTYWSSQQGMRDLGYKGRMAWTTFPGCTHGGVHT